MGKRSHHFDSTPPPGIYPHEFSKHDSRNCPLFGSEMPDRFMNLDYVAGFFDGDGFASLRVNLINGPRGHRMSVTPRIGFSQSKERLDVLRQIQTLLAAGYIRSSGEMAHLTIDRRADAQRFVKSMEGRTVVKKIPLEIVKEAIRILDLANGRMSAVQLNRLLQLRTELLNHMPERARKRAAKGHQKTLERYNSSGLARYYSERETIPGLIRQYRRESGISQERLSKLIGIPRGTLNHYERFARIPRFTHAMKILRFMDECQRRPRAPPARNCEDDPLP